VHVYRNQRLVVKMKGAASRQVLKLIERLELEGLL
jgi:hypothetical protein